MQPVQVLDLRTTKCPLNFVKTKLALEKLAIGEILEVWIVPDGESAINIPQSIQQEGHRLIPHAQDDPQMQKLWIQKAL